MAMDGYIEYQRREYCKAVQCPVQLELEARAQGTPEYDRIREQCRSSCQHTTFEFHHWLIDRGYWIVRKT